MPNTQECLIQTQSLINDYREIAKLHKKELEDTRDMPNWNTVLFRLLAIKSQITEPDSPELPLQLAQDLLVGSLAEMKPELAKMVSPENLPKAEGLHEKIKLNLVELIKALDAPLKPDPSASCR